MVTRRRSDFDATVPANYAALLPLLVVEPWMGEGLCSQTDPEAFFPEKGGSTREAKAVCRRCPVRPECLEFALDNEERYGIWGGLSERERRRLLRIHRARIDGAA